MSARKEQTGHMRFNRLKAVLALRDFKAIELAEQTGFSAQTISKWSTNKEQPRLDDLFKIAMVLECDPSELLEKINPLLGSAISNTPKTKVKYRSKK
jgi:putative transcriptional regulator